MSFGSFMCCTKYFNECTLGETRLVQTQTISSCLVWLMGGINHTELIALA